MRSAYLQWFLVEEESSEFEKISSVWMLCLSLELLDQVLSTGEEVCERGDGWRSGDSSFENYASQRLIGLLLLHLVLA